MHLRIFSSILLNSSGTPLSTYDNQVSPNMAKYFLRVEGKTIPDLRTPDLKEEYFDYISETRFAAFKSDQKDSSLSPVFTRSLLDI